MKIPNPNLHPHGGWFFLDTDKSRHSADTCEGVITRVEAYRKRQGRDVGDVRAEVFKQVCERNPGLCAESEAPVPRDKSTLKVRVLKWLNALLRDKDKFGDRLPLVKSDEEKARADICAGCPHNKALKEGCSTCRAAVREMRRQLMGFSDGDARLHNCEILGTDLQVNVKLDEVPTSMAELPHFCWRRKKL